LVWVVPFWAAGVLVFYVHGIGGWIVARRLRHTGVVPAPDEWQSRLRSLRERLRVSRPVALMESCLAEVPVVIGFLRPVILLPIGLLTGLGARQVEAILIHELAHVRRCDYLVSLMQKFVEGLLFYHPAVWWVSGLIRAERENCCDDVVVRVLGDAHGYAATLATLEEIRWSAREPALAATGGDLMRRVRRLLNQPEGPRPSVVPIFSTAILLVAAAAMLGAWQPAPEPQPQAAAQEVQTPYQKWMTEDVAYIISDEERAAYKRLQTDEEREKFIEQFWLRRDPTPGTAANEFKFEHYRRIAYANRNYGAESKVAGWKTDRGRIYITYGPPDEKETHPKEGFEEWLYHYIDGMGVNVIVRFVKSPEDGAYRMTTDPKGK
jgi:GWxTD domain-containing protein